MSSFLTGKTFICASRFFDLIHGINYASSRHKAYFTKVPMGPPDAILGVTDQFNASKNPKKVSLGVGAYRGPDAKPIVFPTIREAEKRVIAKKLDREYTSIMGMPEFTKRTLELAIGSDTHIMKEKLNVSAQSIAGTGSMRLAANFLKTFWKGPKVIYISHITWHNHIPVFSQAGFKIKRYRYYDSKNVCVAFNHMMKDLCRCPNGSIVLLHACGHNPSGVDPTPEQWRELSQMFKDKKLYAFFDLAYQGFASGDMDADAQSVRIFAKDCHRFIIAHTLSKVMGLYGERVGSLNIICEDKDEAARVMSQLKIMIRGIYSIPPTHGARIAYEILSNKELFCKWVEDLKTAYNRLVSVRAELVKQLKDVGSKHNWGYITKQTGLFCHSNLTEQQVIRLAKEFDVYMMVTGRISMPGVTKENARYIAEAIHCVTK